MYDVRILQDGERHRQTDAIVGTQRGAARLHPSVFRIGLNRCRQRIDHPHTDHIHVVQQYDRLCLLIPFGGRLADHDTVGGIPFIVQMQTLSKLTQKVSHAFFMV